MRCAWRRALTLPAGLVPRYSTQLFQRAAPSHRKAPLHASAALRGDREDPTRLQYSSQVEEAVNQQINSELRASYAYLAMASFFALPSVALPGLESHCWSMSRREHRDALRLAAYQTSRGAAVGLSGVEAPRPAPQQDGCSSTPLQALGASLELQRCLTESLLDLHELASSTGDPVTCDFIATRFLAKQFELKAPDYFMQCRDSSSSKEVKIM
ncbi:ferritin, middle subunit-like [Frankliniella occidentalis]|uniref:Ferritin n=1 Tax=Frankliniella occidentalis TaxID=133901 RepID=A0A9C6U5V1_FRAOC|nr:ferritin, middle subunit-like [Frankliniella occidentalis]